MNLFAKNLPTLKPIIKQKTEQDEKAAMFFSALASVTIGSTLFPNPELLEIQTPMLNPDSITFQTPKRELVKLESES